MSKHHKQTYDSESDRTKLLAQENRQLRKLVGQLRKEVERLSVLVGDNSHEDHISKDQLDKYTNEINQEAIPTKDSKICPNCGRKTLVSIDVEVLGVTKRLCECGFRDKIKLEKK
jgi:hypothetical protein